MEANDAAQATAESTKEDSALRWGARWGPLVLAALLFVLAAGWRLSSPGLQYDECLAAAPAVNLVRGTEHAEPMSIRPSVIRPFGRPLPLMVMRYIGPVKTLLHAPLFAALGISTVTVRLLPLLAGLVSLGLTWWICRRLASRVVADTAVLLLALDPSWVFYLTRDVGPAALAVLLKLAAVATGLLWWRNGRWWELVATSFLLGLGISHKMDFLWVVAALGVPGMALAGAELRSRLAGRTWTSILLGVTGFGIGAAPVVAFNLATWGGSFAPFLDRPPLTGQGSFVGSFLHGLGTRLQQVAGLLDGDLVHRLFFLEPIPVTGPLGVGRWLVPLLAAVSLIGVTVASRRLAPPAGDPRLGVALGLHVAVVLVASCFSPTALNPHHLLTLYPVLQVAMALVVVSMAARWRAWTRRLVPALAVLLVGAVNLAHVLAVDRGLRSTGGVGFWSEAIVELADDLRTRGEPVTVMDWGFTNNLIVLTRGEVAMEPAYRELWRQDSSAELFEPYLADNGLYLLHAPGFERYPQVAGFFRELAAGQDLERRVEARFRQRDGREVYRLVRLVAPERRTGSSEDAP